MFESIIVAAITGLLTLAGVIYTGKRQHDTTIVEIRSEIARQQAVYDVKITELTREVREHNNFALRMPVVEEQIRMINHRLEELERKSS